MMRAPKCTHALICTPRSSLLTIRRSAVVRTFSGSSRDDLIETDGACLPTVACPVAIALCLLLHAKRGIQFPQADGLALVGNTDRIAHIRFERRGSWPM